MNEITLELGCGRDPHPDANLTIDRVPLDTVDMVVDLDSVPWPVRSEQVDRIIAIHVLEHLTDLESALSEVTRILKPGGTAEFRVPVGRQMFTDPTHKQFFTWGTPEFLFQSDHERDYYYDFPLRLRNRELIARIDAPLLGVLSPLLNYIAHRYPGDWLHGTPWFSGELRFEVEKV